MKKSIVDEQAQTFTGKRVLVRVDFNVPQNADGTVADDSRMRAALPTIDFLTKAKVKVILVSHLGRPKGAPETKYSLKPIADHLRKLLAEKGSEIVHFAEDCVGHKAESVVDSMKDGEVTLLENVRFHPGEEKNDQEFSAKLAKLADYYVNDAFGTAHRAHASTEGITKHIKGAMAGILVAK